MPIKHYENFHRTRKNNLKNFMESKIPQIGKAILRKSNVVGSIMYLNLRLYYKIIVIKTVQYWCKNRHVDQWNRIENSEINEHNMVSYSMTKGAKTYNGEESLFNN